jgi:hypothetical protein
MKIMHAKIPSFADQCVKGSHLQAYLIKQHTLKTNSEMEI